MLDTDHSTHRAKSIARLLLEVGMIVVGVFLGLMAEQWREGRHQHELAQASLRNFRSEIRTNQMNVSHVRAYHLALARGIGTFLSLEGPHTLSGLSRTAKFQGMRTVEFEHTAYDLALTTQSLSYLEPSLAFKISSLYTAQQGFQSMEKGFMQSAFTPATFADESHGEGLAISAMTYLNDVNIQEPRLLLAYGKLLPLIDAALGEEASAPERATAEARYVHIARIARAISAPTVSPPRASTSCAIPSAMAAHRACSSRFTAAISASTSSV